MQLSLSLFLTLSLFFRSLDRSRGPTFGSLSKSYSPGSRTCSPVSTSSVLRAPSKFPSHMSFSTLYKWASSLSAINAYNLPWSTACCLHSAESTMSPSAATRASAITFVRSRSQPSGKGIVARDGGGPVLSKAAAHNSNRPMPFSTAWYPIFNTVIVCVCVYVCVCVCVCACQRVGETSCLRLAILRTLGQDDWSCFSFRLPLHPLVRHHALPVPLHVIDLFVLRCTMSFKGSPSGNKIITKGIQA